MKKTSKTLIIISYIVIALVIIIFGKNLIPFSKQNQQTPSSSFSTNTSLGQDIQIFSPQPQQLIKSPLFISGKAIGPWFFEAEFTAEIYDNHNNLLGKTILTAKDNWMTENFVPFEGILNFTPPLTSLGKLKFLSANPSGLQENQKVFEMPVKFDITTSKKILLYYYNPQKDKDESGNIKCSKEGLVAIEREIPLSKTPIQDTINLLLKGKENLNLEDIKQGINTEYPLDGFKLKNINLEQNGNLILEFEDTFNKTIGGSCRVNILWSQIEATAKQFPEVKNVEFLPKDLFQP